MKIKPHLSLINKSSNRWIDSLNDGLKWKIKSSKKNTIFYRLSKRPGVEIRQNWSKEEKQRVKEALDSISAVTAINFKKYHERVNRFEPHIDLYLETNPITRNAFGNSISPRQSSRDGTIKINIDYYKNYTGKIIKPINAGSFLGITFLHELSHSLGLKHPHDKGLNGEPRFPGIRNNSNPYSEKGKFSQNAFPFTQMSYTFEMMNGVERSLENATETNHGYLMTPGSLDIATLQWIYGINKLTNRTDTIYPLPIKNERGTGWVCIWDTGGIDTISGENTDNDVKIDLRYASLAMEKSAGGYRSEVDGINGGFLIAKPWNGKDMNQTVEDYMIENAIGGSGDDMISGNELSNHLSGRDGDDRIYGFTGSDTLIGGNGNDELYGQVDGDILIGGNGEDDFIVTTISNHEKANTTIISDFSETQNDAIKIFHNNILIKEIKSLESSSDHKSSSIKYHLVRVEQDKFIAGGIALPLIIFADTESAASDTITTTIKILNEHV